MLDYNNFHWFTPMFLTDEIHRLFKLFVPQEELGPVNIMVEPSSGDGKAALASFSPPGVVMYQDYHFMYPEDYKLTLLHEAGHFIYSRDHSDFEIYYNYLKVRQRFIEEKVVPDSYEEFLYCKSGAHGNYKFMCSGCRRSIVRNSAFFVDCPSCKTNMLLVGGL